MAYAAVVSLVQILKQLLDSDSFPIHYPKSRIENLYGNISSLQTFLEKAFPVPKRNKSAVTDLETQIRDSVYEAEDAIERYILAARRSDQDLDDAIRRVDSLTKMADQFKDLQPSKLSQPDDTEVSSNRPLSRTKTKPVGLEKDLKQLKDQLLGGASKLEIIPIVGMAGIGKTTLATALYDDPDMENQFDTLAWVTVSQEYNVQEVFAGLLGSMNKLDVKMDDQLADYVYKTLKETRYLVVIDDMWDTKFWNEVRRFFPNDRNGSRIILTTRIVEVAEAANTSSLLHQMPLLDSDNSWKLLCEKVFADGVCPENLVKVGEEISNSCGGLALAIVVIGGLLSKSRRTEDYWRIVADDIASNLAENSEGYTEILSLSYNHLPIHLKGCFLYLGVFPEDQEILVSKLIKLWVAEGFLKPGGPTKSLEEVGREFVRDLVDRNLIMVGKMSSRGLIKTCRVHDLLRDLCVKEGKKEKYFQVISKNIPLPEGAQYQRRVSVHKTILMCMTEVYGSSQTIKNSRSLLYVGQYHHHPLPSNLTFELLRVLDALSVFFIKFPSELVKLIHLRYLSFTFNGKLPRSISRLQNLEILIVRNHPKIVFTGISILPMEIWNMPKLRHVQFTESDFPDPSGVIICEKNTILLENLQTLLNVNAHCCTREVLRHTRNLKRLGMWVVAPDGVVPFYLHELHELETFKFIVLNPNPGSRVYFEPEFHFPSTIKKVYLSGCGLPWNEITILGNLPNLEVLKLQELAFQGSEWNPGEGEFEELKFLLLEYMDLRTWEANGSHFPSLESLIIKHCYDLEEIPSEIGYKDTLQLLEVVDCPCAAASAKKILEEQKIEKNEILQVRVYSSWE